MTRLAGRVLSDTAAGGIGGFVARFAADESGATAIEYAMIAAGIGATVAGAVFSLGGSVSATLFDRVANEMGG